MSQSCDVAILVYDLRASGVVRNALRIAEAASDSGLKVELWPVRAQGEFLDRVRDDVPLRPIHRTTARLPRDLDSVLSVSAIRGAIERKAPLVLFSVGNQMHVHAARAVAGQKGRRMTRLIGRASNAVIGSGDSRSFWRRMVGRVERFQYRSMARIIAVSQELATQLVERLDLDAARISVICNGIDISAVEAAARVGLAHPSFADPDIPVILGAGRISRQKDFRTLIRAFALARQQRAARLVILGRGTRRQIRDLERLAANLGIGGDVWLEGHAANPPAYMRAAAVFVNSSRWEGASNVILEALACGTPIVSTRAPTGIEEVLAPDDLAPLVPVGDAQALAQAILAALDEPGDEQRRKDRARQFDLATSMQAYADALRQEVACARGDQGLDDERKTRVCESA